MNSLSWFLYFADISNSMKNTMAGVSFGSLFILGGWFFFYFVEDAPPPKMRYFAFPAITAFIAIALPNQATIYAIAASEMGEEVLKSSTATKAQKALDAWLDKQIEDEGNEQ